MDIGYINEIAVILQNRKCKRYCVYTFVIHNAVAGKGKSFLGNITCNFIIREKL